MKTLFFALGIMLVASASADEGQWQPAQLAKLGPELQADGITLAPSQLANPLAFPLNAVTSSGYCSGVFVSAQGLILTNHHCGYGMIQHNPSAQNNLIERGFIAKDKAQELPGGPQERIYITRAIKDVTATIDAAAEDLHGKARFDAIDAASKALVQQCENDAFTRCMVQPFYGGLSYQLITQTMFKDVRLVYAPPAAIGKFGGDIDNFEWPRQTGDFSIIRVYVGKDGKPAEYNPNNVPYHSPSFLHINASGVRQGDGILLAGYPGATSRYRLASEVRFAQQHLYPTMLADYQQTLDIIAKETADHPQAAVAYASRVASYNNRLKKLQGLLAGFRHTDIAAIKERKEAKLPAGHRLALEQVLRRADIFWQKHWYQQQGWQSDLLQAALTLYRNALERQKPDAERKSGYQQRDQEMIAAQLERLDSSFSPAVDQALWQAKLADYRQSDYQDRTLNRVLPTAQAVPTYYQHTQLTDAKVRLAWLNKSVDDFKTSRDPFIRLAVALTPTLLADEKIQDAIDGELAELRPKYMADIIAYNEKKGLPVYPDANGTLRVTFGTVDGYQPRDAVWYEPFTSLNGIKEKAGSGPFKVPAPLMKAITEQHFGPFKQATLSPRGCGQHCVPFNSVPVNFLSSADTTGGNSGSPVMDGKGRLVGLNFDSTYESITKDWYYNPTITRAIHLDIRYMLWLLEDVYPAPNLLHEMVIERD